MPYFELHDYEQASADLLPRAYHAYFSGGIADDLSLRENERRFREIRLLPRVFRDVSQLDTATELQGCFLDMPVLVAPMAMNKLAHPEGEMGIAQAAREHGIVYIMSTMATCSLEEVASVGANWWQQLYVFKDRSITEGLVRRAEAAGCRALVVTADVPVLALRQNLLREKFVTPEDMPLANLGLPRTDLEQTVLANFDPGLTWEVISWLRSFTALPIWVKGILRADDALRALDAGAAGIMVSNHGGRQLDTALAAIDALPAIAQALNGQLPLLVDGGIRRGTDILKALALGARAVLLGRPLLWGLAAGGSQGAAHVLSLLRAEFINAMAQCGCRSLDEITDDLIAKPGYFSHRY